MSDNRFRKQRLPQLSLPDDFPSGLPPDFTNHRGTQWWICQGLTAVCIRSGLNGASVWHVVDTEVGGYTRVVVSPEHSIIYAHPDWVLVISFLAEVAATCCDDADSENT
jgi:hypothetical protein